MDPNDDIIVKILKGLNSGHLLGFHFEAEIIFYYDEQVYKIEAVDTEVFFKVRIRGNLLLIDLYLRHKQAVNLSNDLLFLHQAHFIVTQKYAFYFFFTTRAEFVPPKPKEFERNASKEAGVVSRMMFMQAVASSGCSKLMFGAIKPSFIIRTE